MNLRTFFAISILSLTSCSNYENLSKSANLIAEYSGTADVIVGTSNYADTNKGVVDAYEITIKNVAEIDNQKYNPELLASYSAKILFENLLDDEKKERDIVNVKIVSTNKNFEYKYSLNDIKLIDKYLKTSSEFFTKLKSKEYTKMYDNYLDKNTISDSIFKKDFIEKTVLKNEDVFSKISTIELNGFSINKFDNKEIVEIISNTKLPNGHLNFSARFFKNGDGKIVGFNVN